MSRMKSIFAGMLLTAIVSVVPMAQAATTIEVHVRVCQECADRMLALEHFSKLMQADLLTSRCADR